MVVLHFLLMWRQLFTSLVLRGHMGNFKIVCPSVCVSYSSSFIRILIISRLIISHLGIIIISFVKCFTCIILLSPFQLYE